MILKGNLLGYGYVAELCFPSKVTAWVWVEGGGDHFVTIGKIKFLSLQLSLTLLILVTISLNGLSPKYRGIGITIHRFCLCVILHRKRVTNLRTEIVSCVTEAVYCTLHCWQIGLCVPLTLHV